MIALALYLLGVPVAFVALDHEGWNGWQLSAAFLWPGIAVVWLLCIPFYMLWLWGKREPPDPNFVPDDYDENTRVGAKLSRGYVDIVVTDGVRQLAGKRVWGTWYDGEFRGPNPCLMRVERDGMATEVHIIYCGNDNLCTRIWQPVTRSDMIRTAYCVTVAPSETTA